MGYRYRFLRFPEGRAKALTFSYDDGAMADARLAEIFHKYGLKATFNVNGFADEKNPGRLTAEEFKEKVLDLGHEIAVHGFAHRAPRKQRPIEVISDALDCRRALERQFGIIIRGMAYPDSGILTQVSAGTTYEQVKEYLEAMDIVYSRTLCGDNDGFDLPTDWHAWMPSAHHNNGQLFDYIDKFNSIKQDRSVYIGGREPKLMYIWGHSYEFDMADNWDRIEEICRRLGGRDDTWYATNIEIYDYVKAYESLIYSADGMMIYNPTLIDVWMHIDGDEYVVRSGETIRIDK